MGILKKIFSGSKEETLEKGLKKTKQLIFTKIGRMILGKTSIDEEVLDELENILINSDVGVGTTLKIIQSIETRVAKDKYMNAAELHHILRQQVGDLLIVGQETGLKSSEISDDVKPYVILVVGVNGVGKTTTVGKLAARFKQQGKPVVLGAADTFRAAAVDQLKCWGDRVGVPVVSHGMNTDPASVAFDAVKQGVDNRADVVIVDTAGRLHTKINLMNELSKIRRVIQKLIPSAPHEVLLVLDASTGQNAVIQAREFTKATQVTALAITKLDGTAKAGVVLGICDEFKIPVKYIGLGEKVQDLQNFDKKIFVESLFGRATDM